MGRTVRPESLSERDSTVAREHFQSTIELDANLAEASFGGWAIANATRKHSER
jgi:hypothetical protein